MSLSPQFNSQSIAVVGSGAVGRVIASMLAYKGARVELVGREGSIAALRDARDRAGGLQLAAPDLTDSVEVVLPLRTYKEFNSRSAPPRLIIYAVKASYLPDAIAQTRLMRGPQTRTLFLQGGIQWWSGYATPTDLSAITDPQGIGKMLDRSQAYAALVSFGADVPAQSPHVSRLKSNSFLTFGTAGPGPDQSILPQLESLFTNGLIQPVSKGSLFPILWSKAAGSFAMSSFALITGKTLGQMTADPAIFPRMVQAASVLQDVGVSLGVPATVDYNKYLQDMGAKLPAHMMAITRDPSEHEAIIDLPIRIAAAQGFDVRELEAIARESRVAADKISAARKAAAPKPQP